MAIPKGFKAVQCPTEGCGKKFLVKHPGVAGARTYTCPGCGKKFNVRFEAPAAPSIRDTKPADSGSPAAAAAHNPGINVGVARKPANKTIMAGEFNPGWTVATAPASAVLRVTMHRRFLPATVKTFNLNGYGAWTIGRHDPSQPSDIAITGDESVSRRCASIEATADAAGPIFLLRVIKTRNPIFINGRPMSNGESIQLQPGDNITMGKTAMVFSNK